MDKTVAPAAQYLRMSTDHQQYSLDNQSDAIARYANENGFAVVRTYSDAAKSGLRIRNRPGLKELLKDVVGGNSGFRAVLVYDVSRWGRFQDVDESAHYEYLCKSSGVPVHYCAEVFPNDGGIAGVIMKVLKRTMAGEYSRDLSVKVRAGLFRLAKLGYVQGGRNLYGFRRQLLDSQGRPKQILRPGERKSLVTERVILVPGPTNEIAVVQRIFHEFVHEHRNMSSIARRLNEDSIPFVNGAKWSLTTVLHTLQRPQYAGTQVWGRTTAFLSSPARPLPKDKWAICDNAFTPIVSRELFEEAQTALATMSWRLTDEQFLERVRAVLKEHGRLDGKIIQDSRLCPGHSAYARRFGGLLGLYARLGYNTPELAAQATSKQRTMLIRRDLIMSFVQAFPARIVEFKPMPKARSVLRDRRTGRLISLVIGRFLPTISGEIRWLIRIPNDARRRMTLLAFLDAANQTVSELRLFPRLAHGGLTIHASREWTQSGVLLNNISEFLVAVERLVNRDMKGGNA